MKKRFISFLLLLLVTNLVVAQKITVSEGQEVIDGITRTGLYTVINLDSKTVEKAWEKRLKDFGKVSSSKGVYTITGAEIPGVTSKPAQVYSIVTKDKNGVKVWWAIDLGTSFVTSSHNASAFSGAQKVLSDFAASCYREDINTQIAEAEKELSKTVKNYEKEVKTGEDLVKSVEKNKQEKAALEQKLVDNKNELQNLEKDIETNKGDQRKAAEEVEKMKKAVEIVKSKLDQVGK